MHRVRAIQSARRPRRPGSSASSSKTSFLDANTRWKAAWTEASSRTLALFDKPDPLDGPYFEETIYVTPSRLPGSTPGRHPSTRWRGSVAGRAHDRPVHAEMRVNDEASGFWRSRRAPSAACAGACSRIPWA